MTLAKWQARWGHHIPAQALAELLGILSPAMPMPAPTARHSEAAGAAQIRLAAGRAGVPIWRNNNGGCTDQTGRLIRFGLGNESPALNARWKSSDLIGLLPVVVQPSHVGRTLGVFLAVETKKPGWRLTPGDKRGQAQAAFLQSVRGFGGVGGFCCTADDFLGLTRAVIDGNNDAERHTNRRHRHDRARIRDEL